MPRMITITLLRTMRLAAQIRAVTAIAPAKAAATDDSALSIGGNIVTGLSVTRATARLAPLETPKTSGAAKGLWNTVCSNKPLTASAQPANNAVMACGRRVCTTIYSHALIGDGSPSSMPATSRAGISTLPCNRLNAKNTTMAMTATATLRIHLL